MSVWIGRNDIELGTDGPFSLSWNFADDNDTSLSGFSSLMLEDGMDDVEEDGTLDVEEDGMEDDEKDGMEDDETDGREEEEEGVREYLNKDVVVESLFVEVSV